MASTDWVAWHEPYDNPRSDLAQRLLVVQRHVRDSLDSSDRRELRGLSLCAGDGRDLLSVLASHPLREHVSARLVELDPVLAARARAAGSGLSRVEVVCGDAGTTDAYVGAVPADLLLVCGIFGNVCDADVEGTVRALPQLCAPGATVVWTRHRRPPDLTPSIREWLRETAFEELAFESPGPGGWSVGAHRFAGQTRPLRPGERLFAFIR